MRPARPWPAWAGLALLEVIRLTWSKVDLDRGLVEVSGEVKNPYRNRVIPLPQRVMDALRRAYQARPARTVEAINGGAVVASAWGHHFDGGSWTHYSALLKAVTAKGKATGAGAVVIDAGGA